MISSVPDSPITEGFNCKYFRDRRELEISFELELEFPKNGLEKVIYYELFIENENSS
jgi:hypothetical protein